MTRNKLECFWYFSDQIKKRCQHLLVVNVARCSELETAAASSPTVLLTMAVYKVLGSRLSRVTLDVPAPTVVARVGEPSAM